MKIDTLLNCRCNVGGSNRFTVKEPWKKRLPQLLETLVALGRARMSDNGRFGASK